MINFEYVIVQRVALLSILLQLHFNTETLRNKPNQDYRNYVKGLLQEMIVQGKCQKKCQRPVRGTLVLEAFFYSLLANFATLPASFFFIGTKR